MPLDGRPDARAINLDLALVPRLNRGCRILVAARQHFDALNGREREDIGSFDLDGVFIALFVDEIEVGQIINRRQIWRVAAGGLRRVSDDDRLALIRWTEDILALDRHPVLAGDTRDLRTDEREGIWRDARLRGCCIDNPAIGDEIRGRTNRDKRRKRHTRRDRDRDRNRKLRRLSLCRTLRDRGVPIGDEFQETAAPDRCGREQLQPSREDARRLLLADEHRREREAHRPAIVLERIRVRK